MKKLILPALMIVLAVTSAFTTDFAADQKSEDSSTLVQGHIRLSSNPKDCEESDMCQLEFNTEVCRVGQVPAGAQLWRKNSVGECIITAYKPQD